MAHKSGLVAAVEAERRAEYRVEPGPEMVTLFGEVVTERADEAPRAGRPKGARSHALRKLGPLLEARYGESLPERMARIAYSSPAALAEKLGCKPIEAASLIARVGADLLPYVAVKLTPDQVDNRTIVIAPTVDMAAAAGVQVGQLFDLRPADVRLAQGSESREVGRSEVGQEPEGHDEQGEDA